MEKKVNQKYVEMAQAILQKNKEKKLDQRSYGSMSELAYTLPENLRKLDWVKKVTSSLPFITLKGATNALSNLDEALNIDPVTVMKAIKDDESAEARGLANKWERVLKWELGRSSKRRRNLRAATIWDLATYGEAGARLIHIPTQFSLVQPSLARKRAALRFGDWAVQRIDPRTMYVTYSEYMPEAALTVLIKTASQLITDWPGRLPELERKMKDDPKFGNEKFVEFDYVDHDIGRSVWYVHGTDVTELESGEAKYILEPEPWLRVVEDGKVKDEQVPFLPVVAVSGPEPLRPLLYPVYKSGSWEGANIMKTIVMSKAIAMAAAPEHIMYGPGAGDIPIDYTTPGGRIVMPTRQFHEYQPAPQKGLDPSLLQGADRLEADMQRDTVAEVLVTAQPISGEQAFSSYNLQVQQALASIGNIKDDGERFFEQLYENMLLVSHFRGEDIESYMDGNEKYVIDSEKIDPDSIQLSVELKTDVPIDRLARINAAAQLAGSGVPYPFTKILESLGDTDPEGSMKQYKRERMEMADLTGVLKQIEMERSGEIQQMAQQIAQGIIAQMQQQQQSPQEQGPRGQEANPANLERPQGGVQGIGGQGYNPAAGGIPASQGAPAAVTRETRQGAG